MNLFEVLSWLGAPAMHGGHQQVAVWFEVCIQEQVGRETAWCVCTKSEVGRE